MSDDLQQIIWQLESCIEKLNRGEFVITANTSSFGYENNEVVEATVALTMVRKDVYGRQEVVMEVIEE